MLLLDTDPLRPSCVRHRHFRSRPALHRCQHISGFGVQTKMPNFRGCQPFLAIVQSPDGSTYQFVIPAYSYVGPRKSQTHLQVMAEEYLEEHVPWEALLNDLRTLSASRVFLWKQKSAYIHTGIHTCIPPPNPNRSHLPQATTC